VSRIHTALAVACIALVPIVPGALRAYAKAASADRGPAVAANDRVLRSLAHMPGARRIAQRIYAIPRWGHEGALVPTAGYRTELFLRLPRETPAAAIVAHYRAAVAEWRSRGVEIEIAVVGRRVRSYGVYVSQ
jgi:hypothetical protein